MWKKLNRFFGKFFGECKCPWCGATSKEFDAACDDPECREMDRWAQATSM